MTKILALVVKFQFILLFFLPVLQAESLTPSDRHFCGDERLTEREVPRPEEMVWSVGENRWDESWESKYGLWVSRNVDENFFLRHNLPADCADAPSIFRAIFARIHRLPFLMSDGNGIAGNPFQGKIEGHFSRQFAHLETQEEWSEENWEESFRLDQRFRRLMIEVMRLAGARNFTFYTYPVEIFNPAHPGELSRHIRAGTILLSETHVRFINRVDHQEFFPITELSSTYTRNPIRMTHRSVVSLTLHNISTEFRDRGILNWRWVNYCGDERGWQMAPAQMMPGYSRQQYEKLKLGAEISPPRSNIFKRETYKINSLNLLLQDYSRSPESSSLDILFFEKELEGLKELILRRAAMAQEGANFYQQNPEKRGDKRAQEYDLYSTPSTDAAILYKYQQIKAIIDQYQTAAVFSQADLQKFLEGEYVVLTPRARFSFWNFLKGLEANHVSSDPWSSEYQRWGLFTIDKKLSRDMSNLLSHLEELEELEAGQGDQYLQQKEVVELKLTHSLKEIHNVLVVQGLLFDHLPLAQEYQVAVDIDFEKLFAEYLAATEH